MNPCLYQIKLIHYRHSNSPLMGRYSFQRILSFTAFQPEPIFPILMAFSLNFPQSPAVPYLHSFTYIFLLSGMIFLFYSPNSYSILPSNSESSSVSATDISMTTTVHNIPQGFNCALLGTAPLLLNSCLPFQMVRQQGIIVPTLTLCPNSCYVHLFCGLLF